jgi:putative transcriptional regulator
MTEDEVAMAALDDADCPPTPPERLARIRRVSPAKFIRQKLAMSQAGFAAAYGIPLGTLKAWERHEAEPGPVELAYLRAIERAPEATKVPEAV